MEPDELAVEIGQGTVKEVSAKIRFRRSALGIGAHFHVLYTVRLICIRCLGRFSRKFTGELYLTFVEGKDPYENIEKVNLKKTDIDRIYYTGSRINVLIGLREAILLSIPITIVCREECRGLCPVCGKDRNKETCSCPTGRRGFFTPTVTEQGSANKEGKET